MTEHQLSIMEIGAPDETTRLVAEVRRLRQENERMRNGLEAIDEALNANGDKSVIALLADTLIVIDGIVRQVLTPTPAVEAKPKCGTCGGTTRVPQVDDTGRPMYSAPCPDCTEGETPLAELRRNDARLSGVFGGYQPVASSVPPDQRPRPPRKP